MKAICAMLAWLLVSTAADAATYRFTYTFSGDYWPASAGNVVSGTVEGDLQVDGLTILLTAVNDDLTLNGSDFVRSYGPLTSLGTVSAPTPFLLLDGSAFDFLFTDPAINEGFGGASGLITQFVDIATGVALLNYSGSMVVSLVSADVPVPSGVPLLLTGLGVVTLIRRRGA